MFATVRATGYGPDKLRQGSAQLEAFRALRDQQPGYAGAVAVDAGDGRTPTVTLWESEAPAAAARARLEPEAERLLGPLRAAPRRVLARGPVLRTDLTKRRGAPAAAGGPHGMMGGMDAPPRC